MTSAFGQYKSDHGYNACPTVQTRVILCGHFFDIYAV